MHTKEPWVVGESMQFGVFHVSVDETCEFAPRSLALTGVIGDLDHEESVDNARRIVACVNACAGTDNDTLNKIARMSGQINFFNRIAIVEQQRDELLAALKLVREELDKLPRSLGYDFDHIPAIDAAIAKCEA